MKQSANLPPGGVAELLVTQTPENNPSVKASSK